MAVPGSDITLAKAVFGGAFSRSDGLLPVAPKSDLELFHSNLEHVIKNSASITSPEVQEHQSMNARTVY